MLGPLISLVLCLGILVLFLTWVSRAAKKE